MVQKTVSVKANNPIVRLPQSFFDDNTRRNNYELLLKWDKKKLTIEKVQPVEKPEDKKE